MSNFTCNCGPAPVELPRGAYCEICQADVNEDAEAGFPDTDEYVGGSPYDKARDRYEEFMCESYLSARSNP